LIHIRGDWFRERKFQYPRELLQITNISASLIYVSKNINVRSFELNDFFIAVKSCLEILDKLRNPTLLKGIVLARNV